MFIESIGDIALSSVQTDEETQHHDHRLELLNPTLLSGIVAAGDQKYPEDFRVLENQVPIIASITQFPSATGHLQLTRARTISLEVIEVDTGDRGPFAEAEAAAVRILMDDVGVGRIKIRIT